MGKEHNAIFFQAATLITVFPYTLPIYLKSTMPTYYFTVYPQTLFKRQIFISLVSFSTSPIPQLPKEVWSSIHVSEVMTMLISEIEKNLDIFYILKFLYLKNGDSILSLLPFTYSSHSHLNEDKYLSYTFL